MSEYGTKTEVGDFKVTVSCKKKVFGFKISVGDTFGMDEFLKVHLFQWTSEYPQKETYHASDHLGKIKLGKIFGHTNIRCYQGRSTCDRFYKTLHIPILSNKSPPTASSSSIYNPGV